MCENHQERKYQIGEEEWFGFTVNDVQQKRRINIYIYVCGDLEISVIILLNIFIT